MFFNNSNSLVLEEGDQNKLYLTWLFHTRLEELQTEENLNLLNQTWQNVKIDLQKYFHNYDISLDRIIDAFKKIVITADPKIALRYNSFSNTLFSNITELFFSQADIGKKHFVCTISWKFASQLVHEFDHYKIFCDNDLIGKESEIEQFGESQGIKIEERAIFRQIGFLEHCKKNLPVSSRTNLIKVSAWNVDGRPILDEKSSCRQFSKVDMAEGIINYISYLRSDLKKNLELYQLNAQRNNNSQNRILLETLDLYSKNSGKSPIYPELELIL